MSESDDDYDYTREVPMPSDDEDEDLMQVVLAKLLEYMSSNRLSFDAIFRQFDRELAGWSQKNLMDALRAAGMDLSDAEAHTAFVMLCHAGGGDSTRISARTFHEKMKAAKSLQLGEEVRRKEMRQLPPVDRSRRKRVFDRADAEANGWLHEDQVTQALGELYPNFSHSESALLAFEAADSDGTRRIRLREFGLLIEYVRYFCANWPAFDEIGRRSSLNLAQFKAACRDVLPQEMSAREAEHEFEALAVDNNGKVPFHEFCKWAAMRSVPGSDYASPVRTHPPFVRRASRPPADSPRGCFRSRGAKVALAKSALVGLFSARI